jgi:hypothetical protein
MKGVPARKTAKSKLLLSMLALLLFGRVSSAPVLAAEDRDFSYDMRSMIQRNPDFTTYPGSDGVIWLKRVDSDIAPDGGIERNTMWILLGRKGLPPRWLSWNIPVPRGGKAEILEASLYSAPDGEKIYTAPSVGADEPPVAGLRSVTFSDPPEEFVMVVRYREVFPEKLSVDDLVWTSESLPVWETVIRVTVPTGHLFHHFSSQNHTPHEEKIDDRMVYEWRLLNTAAEVHPSIRVTGRDYVVFGSQDDKRAAARFIRAIEAAGLPPPPQAVRDMFGKRRSGAKIVENVLGWLYDQPEIVLTCESREVPHEAPWTHREKMLLANNWLKEAGVGARLFWRLAYGLNEGKPICEATVTDPVLEVSLPDSKRGAFYHDMKSLPRAGGNEVLLGGIVYGLQEASDVLEERRPAAQRPAENRLSALFNLTLSEDGAVTGTVRIIARNAWRGFLFPEKPADEDLARLMKSMFAQTPRYSDLTFSESRTGSEVVATLSGTQVIKGTGGNHIMASLPPLIPDWFESLTSGPFPYNLFFPFVVEARVTMSLPASTANVFLPPQASQISGKVRYTESYKFDKKKIFHAEARMTVDTTSISGEEAARLNAAVQNWRSFMTKYLPVQLRAR